MNLYMTNNDIYKLLKRALKYKEWRSKIWRPAWKEIRRKDINSNPLSELQRSNKRLPRTFPLVDCFLLWPFSECFVWFCCFTKLCCHTAKKAEVSRAKPHSSRWSSAFRGVPLAHQDSSASYGKPVQAQEEHQGMHKKLTLHKKKLGC